MSNMKRWLRAQGISYASLAQKLNQTDGNISQKVNGKTSWQQRDLRLLRQIYGLSSDFVLGFVPYEKEFPSYTTQGVLV